MDNLIVFGQTFIIIAVFALILHFGNRRLVAHYDSRPHLRFRQQLIQIGSILVIVLFVILLTPLGDQLRGQLLSLFGLIVSATIALSSTTVVGNMMAGIMLKVIGNCRPGDYITVEDYFGRISEMDLLHTEIQTEDRDLTTLPNMYLVTKPVRVMRTSGTMINVEVSLGYDVSRHEVEEALLQAARDSELDKPFVQIRSLGDFSVNYRVSGLLTDIKRLLDKRRELRARTMDALHTRHIEIVSPTFMNTRSYETDENFVGEVPEGVEHESHETRAHSVVFDKAEKAESVEKLRASLEEAYARIKVCEELIASPENDKAAEAASQELKSLGEKIERLQSIIDRKEAKISED